MATAIQRIFAEHAENLRNELPMAKLEVESNPHGEPTLSVRLAGDGELKVVAAAGPNGIGILAGEVFVVHAALPDIDAVVADSLSLMRAFATGNARIRERAAGRRWYCWDVEQRSAEHAPWTRVARRWRVPWNLLSPRTERLYAWQARASAYRAG